MKMFVESWTCGPLKSRSNSVLSASRAGSRPATPLSALSEALHWRIGPGGIAWPPEVADDPRAVDSPPRWGGWNPEAGKLGSWGSTGKKDGKMGEMMENLKDLDETLGNRKSITGHVAAIIVFLFGSWCIILFGWLLRKEARKASGSLSLRYWWKPFPSSWITGFSPRRRMASI